jgi:hypothetical protein
MSTLLSSLFHAITKPVQLLPPKPSSPVKIGEDQSTTTSQESSPIFTNLHQTSPIYTNLHRNCLSRDWAKLLNLLATYEGKVVLDKKKNTSSAWTFP